MPRILNKQTQDAIVLTVIQKLRLNNKKLKLWLTKMKTRIFDQWGYRKK